MKHQHRASAPLLAVCLLLIGIFLGWRLGSNGRLPYGPEAKIARILNLIQSDYVEDVDLDSLIEATIPALLENLDPHTAYIPAADLQDVNNELEGSFSGIGISFQVVNDTITVIEIISGGPSEKVGLLAGDRIIAVNDSTVAGTDIQADDVRRLLRGPAGTQVDLKIHRASADRPLHFTVTRGEIPVTSIDASYLIADSIAYIRVNKFGRNTYEEFFTEMLMLTEEGATSTILDLRGNGGGFLDVAVRMANDFLNRGADIVITKGRNNYVIQQARANGAGSFRNQKIVILLDEFSASASEIMAGAIQDNDRGLIIGRRSFGKGLVQQQIDLPDSSAIRLTTARYYTPSGRCIQKPWQKGKLDLYGEEIIQRYTDGEIFNADSIKANKLQTFQTIGGREVYGGGGIIPDIFVPSDTVNVTRYLTQVINAGLLHKFAFDFTDTNRTRLNAAENVDELLELLPPDDILLTQFVNFAASKGIAPRWYYINQSRQILINHLKALIARDALGTAAYYEIANRKDSTVNRAIEALQNGEAQWPIKTSQK